MRLISLGLGCLIGKYFIMNGPDSPGTVFDGQGHLTSVYFGVDIPTVSEVKIPVSNHDAVKISDLVGPQKPLTFLKLLSVSKKSGTCNTAVMKFKNKLYATEETSTPMELSFDSENRIHLEGLSKSISRMCAHLPSEDSFFSYNPELEKPLKLNDKTVEWKHPKEAPFLIND